MVMMMIIMFLKKQDLHVQLTQESRFQCACELVDTWRIPTYIQVTRVNSRNDFVIVDSTVNIVEQLLVFRPRL